MSKQASEAARKIAERSHPKHRYVDEDGFYSCPLAPDAFGHEGRGCDCGLDKKRTDLALSIDSALTAAREDGRREAIGECARHVKSLLEYGEHQWDAVQLANELAALLAPQETKEKSC